jgi:hypothetical protein
MSHHHVPPAVVAVCFTTEEALQIECRLTNEGFLCTTEGLEPQTGASPEILTVYVPGPQAREARQLLARERPRLGMMRPTTSGAA